MDGKVSLAKKNAEVWEEDEEAGTEGMEEEQEADIDFEDWLSLGMAVESPVGAKW